MTRRRGRRGSLGLVVGLLLVGLLLGAPIGGTPLSVGRDPAGPVGKGQPDIVVLVLDDLPQLDDRILERLPTIKRLFLDHGVRFTDNIANDPACCPGRATLLTGQWSHHHGVVRNDARLFDPSVSLATELQAQGYWTGIFGKYLNLTDKIVDKTPPGWRRTFIHGGGYYEYAAWIDGDRRHFGTATSDYSTTQVKRRAIAALKTIKDPARPRFLWLTPFAIHEGLDQDGVRAKDSIPLASDEGSPRCAAIEPWATAAVSEVDITDKPAYLQVRPTPTPQALDRICESLLSVDRMLAGVLGELKAQGRPRPLVVLTADNGMAWGAHRWWSKFNPYATPVPLFIHWPSALGDTPASVATTVTSADLAPTLCAVAGCTMGPFGNGHPVDGISFLSVLLAKGGTLGREVVFEEHATSSDSPRVPTWRGLRTTDEAAVGRWVYTEYETGEKELYDLSGGPCWTWQPDDPGDPCQLTNLAGDPEHAALEARLAATLAAQEDHPMEVLGAP